MGLGLVELRDTYLLIGRSASILSLTTEVHSLAAMVWYVPGREGWYRLEYLIHCNLVSSGVNVIKKPRPRSMLSLRHGNVHALNMLMSLP